MRTKTEHLPTHQAIDAAESVLDALRLLLTLSPNSAPRPSELVARLGIHQSLASRICCALRCKNATEASWHLPGIAGLRKIVQAAADSGASPVRVSLAKDQIDLLARFYDDVVGDRQGLAALAGSANQNVRTRYELTNKQAMFRATSNLLGFSAKTMLLTVFIVPGIDATKAHALWLTQILGFTRSVPNTRANIIYSLQGMTPLKASCKSLHGGLITDPQSLFLKSYSTSPLPNVYLIDSERLLRIEIGGSLVGPKSAQNLTYALISHDFFPRFNPTANPRSSGVAGIVDLPVRTFVLDVFVERSIWQNVQPELCLFRTVPFGYVNTNIEWRRYDQIQLNETMEELPIQTMNPSNFSCTESEYYNDILMDCLRSEEWEKYAFRGYRCRVQYPMYSLQIGFKFDLPPALEI